MKEIDDTRSSPFANADPPDVQDQRSLNSFSLFEGEIEKSTLRYDRQGQAILTIAGWLVCTESNIIALQFAIPGSELSLARRTERPEKSIDYPEIKDSFNCGFQAVLTFKERSMILEDVHFIATLAHGLTVAGALPLPDTFIQNSADQFFPDPNDTPSLEAKWGERLDKTAARTIDKQAEIKSPESLLSPPQQALPNNSKKELLKELSQINATHRLKSFLSLENKIVFNKPEEAIISIIIVTHNKAEYTLDCLQSLTLSTFKNFELIIIDNASTDDTSFLLDKIEGAKIIRNSTNLHFVKSINQNLPHCTGKYTLLLNNDAQITPSAIENAVLAFSNDSLIGAVGGRIIRADGTLQEAGCSILSNGGCYGYGVGMNPWDSRYLFTREVDFCSGTFLAIRTDLFNAAGGFDPRFEPAYFEEVDLQLRLSKAGYKIIYDPKVVIFHAEHGSSSTVEASKLQQQQREVFKQIHKEELNLFPNTVEAVLRSGRSNSDKRKRILIIDDDIPLAKFGTGLPRTKAIIESLNELSYDVTYYPMKNSTLPWYQIQSNFPSKVEVISNWGEANLLKLLIERQKFYDYIWISRPHNLEAWNRVLENRGLRLNAKLIYDAESLFAERELDKLVLSEGRSLNSTEREFVQNEELKLFMNLDHIAMVSERDQIKLSNSIGLQSKVLSIPLEINTQAPSFEERQDILFVGPLVDTLSANVHGIKWFIEYVLPIIAHSMPCNSRVSIAGETNSNWAEQFKHLEPRIKFCGPVEDLTPFYNKAKVVIVPTHFSAGISLKALYGASAGVPIVSTTRIANELNWNNGSEILAADSPLLFASHIIELFRDRDLWNNIQTNAFKKIELDYSKARFLSSLKALLT